MIFSCGLKGLVCPNFVLFVRPFSHPNPLAAVSEGTGNQKTKKTANIFESWTVLEAPFTTIV